MQHKKIVFFSSILAIIFLGAILFFCWINVEEVNSKSVEANLFSLSDISDGSGAPISASCDAAGRAQGCRWSNGGNGACGTTETCIGSTPFIDRCNGTANVYGYDSYGSIFLIGSFTHPNDNNHRLVHPACIVCGNGVVETGEQCDTGGARGACPATCSLTCTNNSCSVCGNGVVNAGEQCDTGAARGACPATCSLTCTNNSCSVCGNGVVDAGEQCDTGGARGACPAACSMTCTNNSCAVCGNGVVETGEQCDTGGARGACPAACSIGCTLNSCISCDCGSAESGTYNSKPTTNLCDAGNSSSVTACGNSWCWTCSPGGCTGTDNCRANRDMNWREVVP